MAQPITITIPHKLTRAEAKARIDASIDRFKAQIGQGFMGRVSHLWDQDRLSFNAQGMGQTITGRLDVHDDHVRIEIDLPAFLAAFADKIAGRLKKEGAVLLEDKRK